MKTEAQEALLKFAEERSMGERAFRGAGEGAVIGPLVTLLAGLPYGIYGADKKTLLKHLAGGALGGAGIGALLGAGSKKLGLE